MSSYGMGNSGRGVGRGVGCVVGMVWHRVLHGSMMMVGRSVHGGVLLHHHMIIVHHGHVLLHHHVVVMHHGHVGLGGGGGHVVGMVPHVFDVGVVGVVERVVLRAAIGGNHSNSKAGQQNDHSLELKLGNN